MTNPLFDLSGRVALVTGGGRGLGFGMAKALAQAGATVVINDLDAARVEGAMRTLAEAGLAAETAFFDLTDPAAVAAGVREVESRVGPIHILLNNAGIQRRHPFVEFPEEDWQAVIDLNLTAPFRVAKEVAKGMIARRAGKIINVASINAIVTRPTIPAYTASKGGIMLLTKSMAVEWAQHNIQANAIAPGYYDTEMTKALVENREFSEWVTGRVPAHRWGRPEDLGGTVVFLASDASNFVNGQLIVVDGGLTCSM